LLLNANALHIPLADKSVNMCVTSPPYYGLRDYGVSNQIGLEQTPDEYVANLVKVFREVWRVMRDDGTLWLNLGDSYGGNREHATESATATCGNTVLDVCAKFNKVGNGIKPKDLIGIPWRVAFALQADGWYLRSDIIWHKPNPMPESVKDRPTKSHEYIFLLSKSQRYYYDSEAIKEPQSNLTIKMYGHREGGKQKRINSKYVGNQANPEKRNVNEDHKRNKRSVWTVTTKPYRGAHYATFPPDLITPCILAGCPKGGIVLDPFVGSGTTVMVANKNGRQGIGLDLSLKYLTKNAIERVNSVKLPIFEFIGVRTSTGQPDV
jgi:DNA modification methylase